MSTKPDKRQENITVRAIGNQKKRSAALLLRAVLSVSVIVSFILISGCHRINTNIEELISPPTLTDDQKTLKSAVEKTIGAVDYKLKRPDSGEYSSSFIFKDVDGDGKEEAIVFYSVSEEDITYIHIMEKDGNGWVSSYKSAGPFDEIAEIKFESLENSGDIDIIVEWYDSKKRNETVEVYKYRDGLLETLFSEECEKFALSDITGDGICDMALFRAVQGGGYKVDIISAKEAKIGKLDGIYLKNDIAEILKITSGEIEKGRIALFVDYKTGFGDISSDAVIYSEGKPEMLFAQIKDKAPERNGDVCEDIDFDGVIEIPYQKLVSGYSEEDELKLYITEYKYLSNGKLKIKERVFRDADGRFIFIIPEKWNDKITIRVETENSEWSVREYVPGEKEKELLRIKVIKKGTYKDVFEENFKLAGQSGGYEYYIYAVPSESELALSFEECTESLYIY